MREEREMSCSLVRRHSPPANHALKLLTILKSCFAILQLDGLVVELQCGFENINIQSNTIEISRLLSRLDDNKNISSIT